MKHMIMPSPARSPPSSAPAPALGPETPAAAVASVPTGDGASLGMSSLAAEQRPLKLNFYWIAGIYNIGQYGCKKKFSNQGGPFPTISSAADVTIINGGTWIHGFCDAPEDAFGFFLPRFLRWAYLQLQAARKWHVVRERLLELIKQKKQQQERQRRLQQAQAQEQQAVAGGDVNESPNATSEA
ncbi:unnamed protein product, partial [Closterium sp. NIES-54]